MVLTCLSVMVDGAIIILWTVCCVDPGTSFSQLFEKLQVGTIVLFQPYAAKLQHCEISQGNVSKAKDTPFFLITVAKLGITPFQSKNVEKMTAVFANH